MLRLPGVSDRSLNRAQFLIFPAGDNMIRPAWQYYSSTSYGINSYPKMGITLDTLEAYLGHDTMARVMRTYHQRWRFRHRRPAISRRWRTRCRGRIWTGCFDQFFFGNRLLDYSVGDVINREQRTPLGAVERNGKRVVVTRKEADAQDDKNEDNKAYKKQYECTVKVRRLGDATAPVDVWIHFKDGGTEKRTWDGQYRWVKYTFLRGTEIDWVQVDPERKYSLDISYANNSWQSDYNIRLSTSWTMQLLFWIQNISLWMTSFV
ncbi:MAG: hypothetical protein QM757_36520 [Paludibaculum sp.]